MTDSNDRGLMLRRKPEGEAPDWRGIVNVGGVEHLVAGWLRSDPDFAGEVMVLRVKPRDEQRAAA